MIQKVFQGDSSYIISGNILVWIVLCNSSDRSTITEIRARKFHDVARMLPI